MTLTSWRSCRALLADSAQVASDAPEDVVNSVIDGILDLVTGEHYVPLFAPIILPTAVGSLPFVYDRRAMFCL